MISEFNHKIKITSNCILSMLILVNDSTTSSIATLGSTLNGIQIYTRNSQATFQKSEILYFTIKFYSLMPFIDMYIRFTNNDRLGQYLINV